MIFASEFMKIGKIISFMSVEVILEKFLFQDSNLHLLPSEFFLSSNNEAETSYCIKVDYYGKRTAFSSFCAIIFRPGH